MTTGERIKALRVSKCMSQEELGALVGVKKAAINKYETGVVVNLKRSTIAKLADALDTTPTYLMGFESGKEPTANAGSGLSEEERKFIEWFRNQATEKEKAVVRMIVEGDG